MRLNQLIKPLIPEPIKAWRRRRLLVADLLEATKPLHPRCCPLCGYQGSFTHFGRPPRVDAQCPSCGCLERHRLFWLWFGGDRSKLEAPIVHFAPEPVLERKFRELYQQYSTASITGKAQLNLNVENIALPTGSVNTVICNHLLEHVSDSRALREICRVLADNGRLVASVPIVEGWEHTYENQSVADPAARELHFGQSDHVRYYGRDFRDRLVEAGFGHIDEITAEGPDVVTYGLQRGEKIFICGK